MTQVSRGFKYESDLEFQREAINAVLNLFEGIPPNQGDFEVTLSAGEVVGVKQTELGIANAPVLDGDPPLLGRERMLKNLKKV